jgi:hypothetical protein
VAVVSYRQLKARKLQIARAEAGLEMNMHMEYEL